MKYERFEDLPVWKLAMEVVLMVYKLTRDRFFAQPGDLSDQLRRAGLSISNNIAEGFERGSTAELLAFLYIARGSAGEARSMLCFIEQCPEAAHLKSQVAEIKSSVENCSRQIRGWADSLQNSDIKGQRHLNEITRGHYDAKKRADAFDKQIKETMRRIRPQDYPQEA
jgi:four helix bundle protein